MPRWRWKNWRSRKSGRVGCKVSKSEECEWKLEFSSLSKAFSRIFNQSQQELRSLVRMKIIRIFVGILFGLQVFRTASGSAVRLVGLPYGLWVFRTACGSSARLVSFRRSSRVSRTACEPRVWLVSLAYGSWASYAVCRPCMQFLSYFFLRIFILFLFYILHTPLICIYFNIYKLA